MTQDGGYDEGYRQCTCFWGSEPGSLVRMLPRYRSSVVDMKVWDAGCGEGKNAIHLARLGAHVDAWDVSELALSNARKAWPDANVINWRHADVRKADPTGGYYDLVIMYGVLHCFGSREEISDFVARAQNACNQQGLHLVASFNDRKQELAAHGKFAPTLLSHKDYLLMYSRWRILYEMDCDLLEAHPHNNVPHVHSMTRLIAEKV